MTLYNCKIIGTNSILYVKVSLNSSHSCFFITILSKASVPYTTNTFSQNSSQNILPILFCTFVAWEKILSNMSNNLKRTHKKRIYRTWKHGKNYPLSYYFMQCYGLNCVVLILSCWNSTPENSECGHIWK